MKKWLSMILLTVLNTCVFAQEGALPIDPIQSVFVGIQPTQNKVQAVKGDGQQHVVYELLVTNYIAFPIRITDLNIRGKKCKYQCASLTRNQSAETTFDPLKLDLENFCKSKKSPLKGCKRIFSTHFNSQELPNLFSFLSLKDRTNPLEPLLQPDETGILFVFLDFPSLDQVPDIIVNSLEIEIEVEGNPPVLSNITSEHFIKVDKSSPIVLDHPPLKGDKWWVVNGPSNFSVHRRSDTVLNGKVENTQRFAVDLIKYGPEGLYAGDPLNRENWYSYGNKIFAVANGTVFETTDGIPQNIPGIVPPITQFNILGNSVTLKLDSGHYAFYAHMIPGSLLVKKGDRVSAGQQLGVSGISGQATIPHLHFQISTQPIRVPGLTTEPFILAAQGIPWVLNKFKKLDYIPIGQDGLNIGIPLQLDVIGKTKIKKQILMNFNLVSFD